MGGHRPLWGYQQRKYDDCCAKGNKAIVFSCILLWLFASAVSFIVTSKIWPPPELGAMDATDIFGAFTSEEALKLEKEPLAEDGSTLEGLSDSEEKPVNAQR